VSSALGLAAITVLARTHQKRGINPISGSKNTSNKYHYVMDNDLLRGDESVLKVGLVVTTPRVELNREPVTQKPV
jgi:hypothetical protein